MLLWASSEHRWANEHFVYNNTSFTFKMTKPFQDTESSQSSGIPYTDWSALIIGLVSDDSSQNHSKHTNSKFSLSTANVFLYTDLSSYKIGDCHRFVLAMVNNVDVCAYFLLIFLLHKTYYFKLHIQVLALLFHDQNWRWTRNSTHRVSHEHFNSYF